MLGQSREAILCLFNGTNLNKLKEGDSNLMETGNSRQQLNAQSREITNRHKKARINGLFVSLMVPRVGIEPTLPKEPDFESGASTNSATPACHQRGGIILRG